MLLNEKEWHGADERNRTEVAHENSVRGNELLRRAESDTGRDTDSDCIGHDDYS
jgi:hypothetical protein